MIDASWLGDTLARYKAPTLKYTLHSCRSRDASLASNWLELLEGDMMIRKTLNASQLQQEVDRRIHRLQAIVEDGVKTRVSRPQLHEPDRTGCN